jgi:putative Mg2+ transporter-C (MgtC) family protein
MDISTFSGPFFLALFLGGLVGLERSHSGHAAGFRTYSLVSLASAMLMWVATSAQGWSSAVAGGTMLSDPSRVVQGILTGVGFLGAGVIVKDGFTVRGLTTAASIWVTASLGILVGSAQYAPALVATVITLAALTTFRNVESRVPRRRYVRFHITFRREHAMPEAQLKSFVGEHGYTVEDISYELNGGGTTFEYHVNMWAKDPAAHSALVHALAKVPDMLELRVVPSRD